MKTEPDAGFIPTMKVWLEGLDFRISELIAETLVIAVRDVGKNHVRVDVNDNHSFGGGEKRRLRIALSAGNLNHDTSLVSDANPFPLESVEFLLPFNWAGSFPIAVAYLDKLIADAV